MLFSSAILLALLASKATAYPHAESKPVQLGNLDTTNPLCTSLELPTEAQYKIGYESFCNKYVVSELDKVRMGTTSALIVATYMLKTHTGTTIPWIFKISSDAWGGIVFFLQRHMCLAGFRDMLEGEKARIGVNYCVVDGTGGNGESKGFSGQGIVLVTGSKMKFEGRDNVNNGFSYETRRRKGQFDPNNPDDDRTEDR